VGLEREVGLHAEERKNSRKLKDSKKKLKPSLVIKKKILTIKKIADTPDMNISIWKNLSQYQALSLTSRSWLTNMFLSLFIELFSIGSS
jgi:hypothetical protein